ncbi:response regulator [Nesterenkonia sphaerica]|uniref:Response regulator transcription factor n=1 Tax=Nesterenkonia sphaerica TaxID=1804988 RepID=A0A5R9AJE0_9MICC|nr:response regulator transcription factor [Nesterenkonia sphaerica]TLP78882.1 response regulator transcription factor [Nesterenkonia sphaerica]
MIRVFLVDDHEIVRRGIAHLINADPGLEVVGESGTAQKTLSGVAATNPDVAVLDVQLPDGNGIELCRQIRSSHPETACLMLTAYDDDAATTSAVVAGASGYVIKSIRGQHLIESIRRVAQGEKLIPRDLARRVHSSLRAQASPPPPELTPLRTPQGPARPAGAPPTELTLRETQILKLITEGLTNRQIGERLKLREKTVKNYVSGLLAKLGMDSRTQVAVYGATRNTNASA